MNYRLLKPISSPLYTFEVGTVKTEKEWLGILTDGVATHFHQLDGKISEWFQRCDTLEDIIQEEIGIERTVSGFAKEVATKYLNTKLSEIVGEIKSQEMNIWAIPLSPRSKSEQLILENCISIIKSHIQ